MPYPRFRFCQLEFPWDLGPPEGRYVLRGHAGEPEHVLVLRRLGAPQRRLLGGRRARNAPPEPAPEPVTVTRATLIGAAALDGDDAADQWLREADLEAEAAAAIAVLNGALAAQRVAAADAQVREVRREHALVTRVGYGAGEDVADGRWRRARELPRPRPAGRRSAALRPQERFAALLAGRDVALAAELLTLRARADLDAGREREAALQLRVALEAALAELQAWAQRRDLAARLTALAAERDAVAAAANRALEGGLEEAQIEDVARVIRRLEAALAARVAGGIE